MQVQKAEIREMVGELQLLGSVVGALGSLESRNHFVATVCIGAQSVSKVRVTVTPVKPLKAACYIYINRVQVFRSLWADTGG